MPEVLLSAEHLNLRYPGSESWALKDVSLELRSHMVLGILGPNGAGKTSLLRAILGIVRPTQGKVYVLGQRLEGGSTDALRQAHCEIGVHLESPGLYRQLTPREYLRYFASLRDQCKMRADWIAEGQRKSQTGDQAKLQTKSQAKCRSQSGANGVTEAECDYESELETLSRTFGLALDQPRCGKLSQGNRQKLHLMRSLLGSPRILLWDEPTDHLDPTAQRDTLKALAEYVRHGSRAAIVASHRIEHLESVCTHVMLMRDGEVRLLGELRELLAKPLGAQVSWQGDAWPEAWASQWQGKNAIQQYRSEADEKGQRQGLLLSHADAERLPDVVGDLSSLGYRIMHASLLPTTLDKVYHEMVGEEKEDIANYPEANPIARTSAIIPDMRPSASFDSPRRPLWPGWAVFKNELRLVRREPRFLLPFVLVSLLLILSQAYFMGGGLAGQGEMAWSLAKPMLALLGVVASALCIPLGADSFAGERERNSLELLWTSGATPRALFLGKALALLPYPLALGWIGQAALLLLLYGKGMSYSHHLGEVSIAFGLTPVVSALMATLSVVISSRAQSVRSASQSMAPLLFLLFVGMPWASPYLMESPIWAFLFALAVISGGFACLAWAERRWLRVSLKA